MPFADTPRIGAGCDHVTTGQRVLVCDFDPEAQELLCIENGALWTSAPLRFSSPELRVVQQPDARLCAMVRRWRIAQQNPEMEAA